MSKVTRFDGKVVSQAKNIHFKKLQDEGVVLNLESGDYFSLNRTALFIWKQCEKPKQAEDLALSISREFGISLDQSKEDLQEFLKTLEKTGLVEISD